jgi:hypothetical protein
MRKFLSDSRGLASRRGLASVVTTMIILVATVVLGSVVVSWSYSSFSTSQQTSSLLYRTNVNALNEKLVVENVAFNGVYTPNNISFDSSNKASVTTSPLTFSLTVANNPSRMLIVTAGSESASSATCHAATVTYSGQSLTKAAYKDIDDSGTAQCTSLWYLVNPPVGTANIVITTSGGAITDLNGGAISLYNVAQQGPEATATNSAIGNPPSITTNINTLSNNAWVVDSVGSGNAGAFTAGSGQISRYTISGTSSANSASTKLVAVAGVTSMQESQAANRLVHILASFAPSVSLSSKVLSVAMDNVGPSGITLNSIKITNSTNTVTGWSGSANILSKNSLNQNITYNWATNVPVSIQITTARGSVYTANESP